MLRYPIAIEPGTDKTAFGVVVPDLPGCFSAGDTLDEALINAEEAIALWIDATLDEGNAIPAPSSLDRLREARAYAGWTFALVSVDPAVLDDTVERVNITLPKRVLSRLDAQAKAVGETRSGFIAHMTLVSPTEKSAARTRKNSLPHSRRSARGRIARSARSGQ